MIPVHDVRTWSRSFAFAPSISLAVVVSAISVGLAGLRDEDVFPAPVVYDPRTAPTPHAGAAVPSRLVAAHDAASVHHLVTSTGVKPHIHRSHEETVVVVSGTGRVRLADETHELTPGLTLVIPRGTVHSLEVDEGVAVAVSVFTPAFDGVDRVFLDAGAASARPLNTDVP